MGATAGHAASEAAELRKHTANDAKCAELGWVSHPSCGGVLRGMGQVGSTVFISTQLYLALLSTTLGLSPWQPLNFMHSKAIPGPVINALRLLEWIM